MPNFAGIDRHVPHTTQHGFGTVQSRHVKKTYLKNYKKRRLHGVKTSDKICEKRLTGYKKLQGGNVGRKKCKKSKKHHTRLLSTAPPLPQKRKQNYAQKFRQIFRLLQFPENSEM